MKLCIFEGDRCSVCGSPKINKRQACMTQSDGLGDIVAAGLSAVGITKELVGGIVGGDCGCRERQEFLNKIGHIYLGIGSPTPSGPLDA